MADLTDFMNYYNENLSADVVNKADPFSNLKNFFSGGSYGHQQKVNDFNFGLEMEQKLYDRALQQTMFQREDNAVQRRVADLKKAGLSPLLAASGSGAGAGSVVSSSATPSAGNNRKGNMDITKLLPLIGSMADISKTRSQEALLKAQTEDISLRNKWYKDNPSWVPGMFDSVPGLIGGLAKMAIDGSLPSSVSSMPIIKWLFGNISDTSTPDVPVTTTPSSSPSVPTLTGRPAKYRNVQEAFRDGWSYVGGYYYERNGHRAYYDDIIGT